ncbi:hypothetical protein LX36DRAFT_467285 [Colletotrichum falcatum]|nr:hypothetical protein LX36DRAFT_467285 [Colletotrichum falcatum]
MDLLERGCGRSGVDNQRVEILGQSTTSSDGASSWSLKLALARDRRAREGRFLVIKYNEQQRGLVRRQAMSRSGQCRWWRLRCGSFWYWISFSLSLPLSLPLSLSLSVTLCHPLSLSLLESRDLFDGGIAGRCGGSWAEGLFVLMCKVLISAGNCRRAAKEETAKDTASRVQREGSAIVSSLELQGAAVIHATKRDGAGGLAGLGSGKTAAGGLLMAAKQEELGSWEREAWGGRGRLHTSAAARRCRKSKGREGEKRKKKKRRQKRRRGEGGNQ